MRSIRRIASPLLALLAGVLLAELWARVGALLLLVGAGAVAAWIRLERRPDARRGRRWLARAAVAFVFVLWVSASEGGTYCVGKPRPVAQIVRGHELHLEGGTPVWVESHGREHRACAEEHPEKLRVLLFGSSITFGSGLRSEEAFSAELERRLDAAHPVPGVCVLNFAQPGFAFEQQVAVARVEVARYRPALVLWESWGSGSTGYRMLGDAAFALRRYALTPDGFPRLARVPERANRALFLHSHLYQLVALARAERDADRDETTEIVRDWLPEAPGLVASAGARLGLYLATPLDRPFAELVASPPSWQTAVLGFARERGIPAFVLQQELAGEDYESIRNDPCCHFNARGHRALVPVFERIVEGLLGAQLTR
jgi:hypothetical protein